VIPHPNANYNAYAYDIVISGNLLHVAFGIEGYMCYDITNPLTPNDTLQILPAALTGSTTAEAISVYADGNDVFIGCRDLATGYNTITWINLVLPGYTLMAMDTLHDEPTDIYVDGNYIFVAEQNAGLEILRWSSVPAPAISFVSLTSTNAPANRVYVSGTEAYIAASSEGLVVLDISNKASPYQAAQWTAAEGNDAQGIYFSGKRAYLADGEYGLRVLDITDPLDPVYLGTKDLSEAMAGNYKLTDVWVRSQAGKTQAILSDWFDAIHMIEW